MKIRGMTSSTLVMVVAAAIALSSRVASAQTIPSDPQQTCVVGPPLFASWFVSGTVTKNGVVKPANSITFPGNPNCGFYQWSDQMYLWLTSPAPSIYGPGAHVFDSAIFFDVSPPDANNQRVFIRHTPGLIRTLGLRAAQVGPHRLPIVFDKRGTPFEIEPTPLSKAGKPLVVDPTGKQLEVERVQVQDGKAKFLSKDGKAIPSALPLRKLKADSAHIAQKFMINNVPILIDPFGNVIDVEVGQAGGNGVLIAQNGSLIYYATMVNDVYAYFLTGAKNGAITPATQFPTTQADVNKVVAYAQAHGATILDSQALAIEVKTSWIEATSVPDLQNYITMKATIPTYNKSNTAKWTPSGQKTTTLAMVGMHVVGSTAGHPEMIWATWEHPGTAPNAAYTYNSLTGPKVVAQNTSGTWLFTATNSTGPFNNVRQQYSSPNIVLATPPSKPTIGPNDTLRLKPWGASSNVSPNPVDATAAASNTEIISINNSVRGQLISGDPRFNYFMTGSTWTIGGVAPTGAFNSGGGGGNEVGTSQLANITMETFQQGASSAWNVSTNCFFCHSSNTTNVSHIYGPLKPLFPN